MYPDVGTFVLIRPTQTFCERIKVEFRQEIEQIVSAWRTKGWKFDYTSEPRLKAAIESQLFPAPRTLERALSEPRFARQKVEWAQRRSSIVARLISTYGYCGQCAADLTDYATHVLKNKPVTKTPKNETVEWLWPLDPVYPEEARAADSHPGGLARIHRRTPMDGVRKAEGG